ncbi:MAG: chemotaxis protein CheW [Myxococcales bacterium]|nr:chemotaxis protein CheW [Myxococcales bacterium]
MTRRATAGAVSGALGRRLRGMVGTGAAFDDERDGVDHDELKLAGFFVGGGLYGIDIMRIKEVIQARPYPVRPVPHAPPIVEGVIQLRGVVIPVIDLRKRFGATPDPEVVRLNKLIIVSVRGRIVGLRVDRILGELRVPAGALRPAPSMLRGADGEVDEPDFFSGVCRVGNDMVFVINLETIIDPTRGVVVVRPPDPPAEQEPPT